MTSPSTLRFTNSHEWIQSIDGGKVRVGISDHAQEALGDIVFVELPASGQILKTGEECAVMESVKAAADIYAPVSGTVTAVNLELTDSPGAINEEAFAAWLFEITPLDPKTLAEELETLMDAESYNSFLAEST